MRISTKGRHAVMAMVDLARHQKAEPIPLSEIAERQGISLSYLEQLIARLKAKGLVRSVRGPGGGYLLKDGADAIVVSDIIEAVDDPTPRIDLQKDAAATCRELTDVLWQGIGDRVTTYLKSVTLAQVVEGHDLPANSNEG